MITPGQYTAIEDYVKNLKECIENKAESISDTKAKSALYYVLATIEFHKSLKALELEEFGRDLEKEFCK